MDPNASMILIASVAANESLTNNVVSSQYCDILHSLPAISIPFIGSSHMTSPAAICKGFVTASLLKSYGHQIKSLCFITQLSLHAMSYLNSKFLGNML